MAAEVAFIISPLIFVEDALEIIFVPDKAYAYCGITVKPMIGFSSMKKKNSNNLSCWDFSC